MGSLGSFGMQWLQQRAWNKHDRMKMAVELAKQDQENAKEIARRGSDKTMIPPLAAYVNYHSSVLHELAKGALSAGEVKKPSQDFQEML